MGELIVPHASVFPGPGWPAWVDLMASEPVWTVLDLQPQFCKGIYLGSSGFHSNVVLFSLISAITPTLAAIRYIISEANLSTSLSGVILYMLVPL